MNHLKRFNESLSKELILTHKRNSNYTIRIIKSSEGKIESIENNSRIRFPFNIDQLLNIKKLERWACENNFYVDGKDTCPEKKIFGIRTKDVPKNDPLRLLYPSKFR